MSYCRFSSDNWKSDVYVYEHHSGVWVIHVAGNRPVGEIPRVPRLSEYSEETADEWVKAHTEAMEFLRTAERVNINLPHAGATFDELTPGAAAERLKELRALGYHIPEGVIEELEEEDKEETE